MHQFEGELKERNLEVMLPRLLTEALFVINAFTFYNGSSPYNALLGRQPACLPDLPTPDFDQKTETSDHAREQHIRAVSLEAITQATAVAKTLSSWRQDTHPRPSAAQGKRHCGLLSSYCYEGRLGRMEWTLYCY